MIVGMGSNFLCASSMLEKVKALSQKFWKTRSQEWLLCWQCVALLLKEQLMHVEVQSCVKIYNNDKSF